MLEEITYRFPYSRTAVELVPDLGDTLRLRLAWQRGKAVIDLVETTPLRALAEVVYKKERFTLAINEHRRERRERIALVAHRHAGTQKAMLRCDIRIEGREDRLTWDWKVAARSTATRRLLEGRGDIILSLPLRPGRSRILTLPSAQEGLVVWRDGVAISVVMTGGPGRLSADEEGIRITLEDVPLRGQAARLETRFAAAPTEQEARLALLRHLAAAADDAQRPQEPAPPLAEIADRATAALMADGAAEKRGVDRLTLRTAPGRHVSGEGVYTALVARTLYNRYRFTGDDAEKRRSLLLARGACDFQLLDEESTHRGAFWDAFRARKHAEDIHGGRTLSVAATARATEGLFCLHAIFGQEVMSRAALAGAQWLLLKMDRDGFYDGERYTEEGPPVPEGSPWSCAEALRPLAVAYRRTGNEVFLKAAVRVIQGMEERLDGGGLPLESVSADLLAAAIDGVLCISREAENESMVAMARRLGLALRAWRLPDGSIGDRGGAPSLEATLAGVRGALALARVDGDIVWPLLALRGLRAATALQERGADTRFTDHEALCSLPSQLLLTLGARAPEASADRDAFRLTRGWQVFDPDSSTRDFLRVTTVDGETPVDHLGLVCPFNLQVLVVVLAPAGMEEVRIVKNKKRPYLKNLLTGDYDFQARLVPLGDGREASFGVFAADT